VNRGHPGRVVAVAAVAYAALFTALTWLRQDDFQYGRFDLGNMAQAVWNTAHGRVLEMSDAGGHTLSRLGIHVDPMLGVFAPLYRIWPDPKLLLLGQAAFVATGAWPAYLIARAELRDVAPASAAAGLAIAYLLYPPVQWATVDEFHPVTLAPPLLLFAIWFLRERRYVAFGIAAAAAMACKEEVGLVVAALGVYAAFAWGQRRTGVIVFALGLGWSLFAFQVVIPHYNPGGAGPFGHRYEAVGGDVPGIAKTLVTDPLAIAREGLSGRDLGYLAGLVAPFLLLPLAAPAAALVALPELAANMLSSQHAQGSWRFHYVAAIVPVLWWASVLGLKRLLAWWSSPAPALATLALPAACLGAAYSMGPVPWWSHLPAGADTQASRYSPSPHDDVARRAVKTIPSGAPVSTANLMGSHVSNRRFVALFPRLGRARYVIVDRRNPSIGEANGRGSPGGAGPIRRRLDREVAALESSGGWQRRFDQAGVVVLQRRPKTRTETRTR
jgi:uncharacterized membrane protein